MKRFIINSGLIYFFPVWMILSSILFVGAALWSTARYSSGAGNFIADFSVTLISLGGFIFCSRAALNMLEEIPEIRRMQKEVDKFIKENTK